MEAAMEAATDDVVGPGDSQKTSGGIGKQQDTHGTPPVHAFWSITMYDVDGYLVPNIANRSAVSSWHNLTKAPNGDLTLYIQQAPPAQKELYSNWLPSPRTGPFDLTSRSYWPAEEMLNGSWAMPELIKQQ
jgi:hypothetical protein